MIETFEINEQFIMNIRFLCCNYLHISHKAIIYTFHTKQLFTHFTQSNYLHISHKAIIYTFHTKQLFTHFTQSNYLHISHKAIIYTIHSTYIPGVPVAGASKGSSASMSKERWRGLSGPGLRWSRVLAMTSCIPSLSTSGMLNDLMPNCSMWFLQSYSYISLDKFFIRVSAVKKFSMKNFTENSYRWLR